jgi:signal transduction histidine kinase/FixJ family two-component response regulator
VAGEKILVVGSDAGLLKNLADEVLSPLGFRPLLAVGQDEGVKAAVDESPNLLLLHLPVDSSVSMLHRLSQAGRQFPSILVVKGASVHVSIEMLRLGVRDYLPYPFTPEEALQTVCRVLGQKSPKDDRSTGLKEDASIFEYELEDRVKEFDVLLGIGRSVNSLLDLDLVLNRATEAAVFVTGAEEGYLLLVDEETGELRLRAAQNLGENQAQGFSLRIEDPIAVTVVGAGRPMLLSGDGAQNLKVKTGYLVKSLLNVPLKVNGRVIGVLGVDNQISGAQFTQTHLRRLTALADLVATAVENARRYTDLQEKFTRRVREVATLQAVADQMSAVTDFDVGARLALSSTLKATNAEAGVLAWAAGDDGCPSYYISQGSLGELVLSQRSGATPERWWDEQTLQLVIKTGQSILKDDLDRSGNGQNPQARSRLAVPMRRGRRVIGAINLESSLPHAFTQDDLYFVRSVADQVAVALEGTVLHEEAASERERWALLMKAVDNAVWVVDADLRLLAQNEFASEMLGWPTAEAVGRSVYELQSLDQSSPNGLCQLLSQVMEQQQHLSFPQESAADGDGVLLETIDGRSILVRGRGVPLVQDGLVVGAICAFREVLSEKGDSHVRFEFANMASHLLRSPLSLIQASIDLMQNSELDAEEQRMMLERMREQSQRIREFIKDLLEMSRLETGSVQIYSEPLALPPLVERVLDLIRPEEPRYVFSFVAPGTFPVVTADPGKTELILLSLLRNAMSRCPDGGSITLELEARKSEAVVSIVDDGEAIPLRQLDRVFSQFYPVDDDDDKMPSTYRLGLYTTRRLIELQDGSVWAESQPDKGTRFGFSLPIWG